MEMLCCRLLPLGCVRLGMIGGSDDVSIVLQVQVVLAGCGRRFRLWPGSRAQGQIVVQPNFEIVFLAPSPLAEASLARFARASPAASRPFFDHEEVHPCRRRQRDDGRPSARNAHETLRQTDTRQRGPRDRRLVRSMPSHQRPLGRVDSLSRRRHGRRVVAAGGKKAVLLTDTVVELTDSRAKTELLRKLHGLGIFTESSTHVKYRRPKIS